MSNTPIRPHQFAFNNEILRGVVGSSALGLSIGGDDRDEMGICIEPPEYVMGLRTFEQFIHRDQPEGVRSGPDDLDLTIYSMRKFCRLAKQGNPSILLLLWLPQYEVRTEAGDELLQIRDAFFSKQVGERFLGYLVSQRLALTGERSKTVNRPELVEKYGYDTKFAYHAVRLGMQGIEYLTTRKLTLPVPEPVRSICLEIRRGERKLADVLSLIQSVEQQLKNLIEKCDAHTDHERIDNFLIDTHLQCWKDSK